jgi:hypothetical protein
MGHGDSPPKISIPTLDIISSFWRTIEKDWVQERCLLHQEIQPCGENAYVFLAFLLYAIDNKHVTSTLSISPH